MSKERISVTNAARLMGISDQYIRLGLQKGVLPFGYAVKMSKNYTYFISAKKFTEHTGIEVPEDMRS